ncbi:hypothetical protein BAUCODRAFT_235731 [Baudoinia panamericana UAMH 10762]|uniref:Amino acid transporter transmembrane domain-containing protein n=1 Tax=Baudoinia panamericana (strain UAMH 10762) TaxID=717646 RepID=M2LGS1_BAUPA|nr:uncharacterized protein BAUCODRAFT_235731 [Baudoinia panamericana UAMH 10762]EMC93302.1 hypothetical protein BAUCODRAFT_235731 [Baudoinia panamericana UAMH 10762]
MAQLVPPATAMTETTMNDFNQKVSPADQERIMLQGSAYEGENPGINMNRQPLEVYQYWARLEREREAKDMTEIPDSPWVVLFKMLTGRSVAAPTEVAAVHDGRDPEKESPAGSSDVWGSVSEDERSKAYRALRVASWQAVFYLITTDILGFSSAPEAFLELGLGPGILVYFFFYVLAVFAGQVIWKMYMETDSSKYPVVCYADLGERIFGRVTRHIFNVVQSLQLVFNVALLIIGNGQTLVTMIEWKFCYLALNIFFMLIGMIAGQVRSLRNFAWFANINIWLNIIVMIITLVGTYRYPPVPSQSNHADLSAPKSVSGWVPTYTDGWYQQVSGVQLAVFAYGGAMIFPEFMAEMRRPRDFWKSMLVAQFFCFFMYMMFGLLVYCKQGMYASILPGLNFANQTFILANNVIGLISTMVAAVLYGNIGVKVFYVNVLQAYFKAPSMLDPRGRFYWAATVIGYWAVAWVLGSAIPNITALVTLVGAACILQFTYTFPPLLLLGYWVQVDAAKGDNPWTPDMAPRSNRIDSWKDKSRWTRGLSKYWYAKLFLALLFVAALANCALGIYAGIETAIGAYGAGYLIPFSCYAPNDPRVNGGA